MAKVIIEEAEIAQLIQALNFYADPETYLGIAFLPDHPCGDFIRDFGGKSVRYKPGKRARKALNRLNKYMPTFSADNPEAGDAS